MAVTRGPIWLDDRGTGQWKWLEEVSRRTSLVPPLRSLVCTLFNKGGSRGAFRLPGAGGDHFHCTVEPSPGHIRCRVTHRIGANPEKPDSVNFRRPDWRKFSELCVLLFSWERSTKCSQTSWFSKRIFGHPLLTDTRVKIFSKTPTGPPPWPTEPQNPPATKRNSKKPENPDYPQK